MDARWLDRCWPLTRYARVWEFNTCANAYFYVAYESCSRRYRRVQACQAQGDKGSSSSRCQQQLSTPRRVGRETYIGSYNRSRRSYHLSVCGVPTTRGPSCTLGSKCARRRNCFIASRWCGHCKTCRTRGSRWIGSMFMVFVVIWISN